MSRHDRDWRDLKEIMEHMLRDATRPAMGGSMVWHPATDVYETEKDLVIRLDVAGVRRDDLKVVVAASEVVVRGVRRDTVPPGKKHFYKMEITLGPFERKVPLPDGTRITEVQATYRDGILEVRCRKSAGGPTGEVTIEIL